MSQIQEATKTLEAELQLSKAAALEAEHEEMERLTKEFFATQEDHEARVVKRFVGVSYEI